MKQLYLFLFVVAFLALHGRGQGFASPKEDSLEVHEWNAIYFKTNPLTPIHGPIAATSEFRFGFEAMAAPRLSYQPSISYLGKSPLFSLLFPDSLLPGLTSQDFTIRGYRLQGQVRYFYLHFSDNSVPNLMRPNGLYTALHASYSTATFRIRGFSYPRVTVNHFNVNVLFGGQLLISDAIGLDVFTGFGFKENTIYEVDQNQNVQQADLRANGFGLYYRSNFKFSLGFNLAIGLW